MRRSAASALVAGLLLANASPAQAAGARVQVSPATADPDYATTLTLRGSGFQSVPKGYGGIYVLFGWVADGPWPPSKGGAAGATYRYVPDKESKDNRGFQRFVAFPGSDTASSANGGQLSADGAWSTQLVVPGARFRSTDRDGKVVDVDCLTVRCGLITVGAHGVVNANNETFTPVGFAVPTKTAAPPPASPSTSDSPTPTVASPMVTTPTIASQSPVSTPTPQPAAAEAPASRGALWWVVAAVALLVTVAALTVPPLLRRRRRSSPDQEGTGS
ncbi:hypothetical protein VA596_31605 [Amycolatopsis sp., V23-08]|uniref:Minor silk ampullate protein n=1 Tax=Amycolatopsis heterodermiae TaxID=3110235 RepID=A0ABU5RCY6_9PSEU|nr:hypothetical protein [Amycolatopsis sp., V23-08]MEA5364117.1 hypothetical protein [Amycolatopsis sp., V23-08]